MLEAYREHVAEREALGIPPKPLNAEQTAALVELLKNPPAGEEETLVYLLENRIPPGVDEAAYVKAAFLTAIVKDEASSPLLSKQKAVELLGMMQGGDDADAREIAEQVAVFWPNQSGRGTHVNASGAGIVKHAKNRGNAVRLLEFLSDSHAQELYASRNFEYPVKSGVGWSDEVKSWGVFKADDLALARIFELGPAAQRLIDRVGWQ